MTTACRHVKHFFWQTWPIGSRPAGPFALRSKRILPQPVDFDSFAAADGRFRELSATRYGKVRLMARSIRPILGLMFLAESLIICQASDPAVKKETASPPTARVAVKPAPAKSPERVEALINVPTNGQPTADVVSKPARIIADTLAATEEAREIVIANLANAETLGYKRQIVSFATVLAGPSTSAGARQKQELLPCSYRVGVAMAPPVMDMSPGKIRRTGRPLDLAIAGEGLFCVMPADVECRATIYYTRCGRFTLDERAGMVLHGLNRDWVLLPRLEIPEHGSNVEIRTDGRVRVTVPGESRDGKPREDRIEVGTINLHSLAPDCEFTPCGDNVFVAHLKNPRGFSGGTPGQHGWGELRQGCVEESNVIPQQELDSLQKLQEQARVLEQAVQFLKLTDGPSRESAKRQSK
jgi:flagellar basal-body rod protein FlgG